MRVIKRSHVCMHLEAMHKQFLVQQFVALLYRVIQLRVRCASHFDEAMLHAATKIPLRPTLLPTPTFSFANTPPSLPTRA
jgi:hypothetical protein